MSKKIVINRNKVVIRSHVLPDNFMTTLSRHRDNYMPVRINFMTRGSALIITLLVIMVISSIGLGVGRLTLSEIKQTSRMEDSAGAETAAESGIEHGLLLYRFNHDVQLSDQCPDPANCTISPTETGGKPVSFDMGNGVRYELKIWHRNGNDGTKSVESVSSESGKPALGQDQTAEYDLHNPGDDPDRATSLQNLTLSWEYEPPDHPLTPQETENRKVEITPLDADNAPLAAGKYLSTSTEISANVILTNATRVRIKPWGGNLKQYTFSTTDPKAKLDHRMTIIESTGYFGNTKRKLQVKIDRASGTILGIGDFVIYSGTGDVTAP